MCACTSVCVISVTGVSGCLLLLVTVVGVVCVPKPPAVGVRQPGRSPQVSGESLGCESHRPGASSWGLSVCIFPSLVCVVCVCAFV